jgi:hypothetical protein
LRDDRRVVEVDRLVEGAAGGIVVDHLDVLAHGAGGEDVLPFVVALPRDRERHLVQPGRVQLDADARIEGEDPQAPLHRAGNPSRTGGAFQQICLSLPASRRPFDLVADDARFGVDEHRAAGRARVVSLDDLDHPLQAEVTGESRPLAQVEGNDLERFGEVDHPELL